MKDFVLMYDPEKGVIIHPQAAEMKAFKDLHEADKGVRKGLYKLQLEFLYYIWSQESFLFNRYTPQKREEYFFTQLRPDAKPEKIKTPELVRAASVLQKLTMTMAENQLQQILVDFDRFFEHLKNIPWEKAVNEEVIEGKKRRNTSYKISNQDERMKAVNNLKRLLELQQELEKIVRNERKVKSAGDKKAFKFEDPESITNILNQ